MQQAAQTSEPVLSRPINEWFKRWPAFLPWSMWDETRPPGLKFGICLLSILCYLFVYGIVFWVLLSPFVVTEMWWIAGSIGIIVGLLAQWKLHSGKDPKFWRIVLAVCIVYVISKPFALYFISSRTVEAMIHDSERIAQDGKTEAHYRLTTSLDSYKIIDSWWYLQFKSSNLHGYAKANTRKICKVKIYGVRIALLSMFPTVYAIDCPK